MEFPFDPEAFAMTLRQTSYDDAKNYYLADSDLMVYNFDRIKEYVCRKLRDNSLTRSCDAYYVSADGREYLIEFKNQSEADISRHSLKQKAYDSVYLLLLTFDRERSVEETARNLTLLIVYNDRAPEGPRETRRSRSQSFELLAEKLGGLAGVENPRGIRFGLSYLRGRLFQNICTLDVHDFMRQFVARWLEESKGF